MSKHQIPAKNDTHICVVGYDGESDSFFAVVEDTEVTRVVEEATERIVAACRRRDALDWLEFMTAKRNATIHSLGTRTVEELAELLSPFAEMTRETVELLLADRLNARRSEELDAVVIA